MKAKPSTAGQVGLNCPKCGDNMSRASVAKSHPTGGGQYRLRYCGRCHQGVETLEAVKGQENTTILLDVTDLLDSERRVVIATIREFRRLHGNYDEYTGKLKREQDRRWGPPHASNCQCVVCDALRPLQRPEPMFEDDVDRAAAPITRCDEIVYLTSAET